MKSLFSSDFFAGNRGRLRDSSNSEAPIIITANGLLQRSSIDNAYQFVQDASFWYLTGINEPDLILVMDKADDYLIVPARPAIRETFDGALAAEGLKSRSGIGTILDNEAGWERLGDQVKKTKQAATPAPYEYSDRHGIYPNPARSVLADRLKSLDINLELVDIRPQLSRLRMIKQPVELKAMQKAVDITIASINDVFELAKRTHYKYEYEIEAEITKGFRRRGASGHSFPPIVAGGERACMIHNTENNAALSSGELIVIDVGAEFERYSADITRTVSLGTPSKRQREVHAAVLEVQRFALELLKPGIKLRDYELQVRQHMGEKLRGLGLIKTNDPKNVQKFYPHGTSHYIGLDVHDVGDYERPLEPGVVVSCEPGIYISKEGIGVRIEDDVLITKTGNQVLTAKLPKNLA